MKFRLRTTYIMVVLLLGMFVQQSYGYIPSRQAKFITFSNVNATEMTINWVSGNGEEAIVLVKAGSAPDVTGLGDNSSTATADAAFGTAPEYPASSGNKLVYDGTANTVTVTGLAANTTYHVMVLEYNNDGSAWDINTATAVLNPRSKTTLQGTLTPPSGLATDALTKTTATVSWTTDGTLAAGYYIDVRLESGAILTSYDLLDIGLPETKKFYISGLTGSVAYEWRLRPYDQYGRTGAATDWEEFTTLETDPEVTISGSGSNCGGTASLIASWETMNYSPQPAAGTWTTLVYPTGASVPSIVSTTAPGTSTGTITVDNGGEYVFQFEISVGEYYHSTTAGYTFSAPDAEILTTTESTCGTYVALKAETTDCNVGTGTWSVEPAPDGMGTFGDSESKDTYFELTGTPVYGNYTFRWTSTLNGLTDYDEVVISFNEKPTVYVTTSSVGTCGLDYTLDGNTPITGASGSWYKVSGPGTPTFTPDATSPNATLSVDIEGYYSFLWQVSNSCATVGAPKHVTFYAEPTIADAGEDDEADCGLTYTLGGNQPTYGVGVWSGPAGAVFSNSGTYNSSVTIPSFVGESTYASFTWTISNGTCNESWDDVTVTFYNKPIAIVTTPTDATCGLSIVLDGNDPTIGTGSWSVSNQSGPEYNPGIVSFDDATVYNTTAYVSVEGMYSFVWTLTNGTCTADAGKQVTFYAVPSTADAGNPTSTCGTQFTLGGNDPAFGVGTWTVSPSSDVFFVNSNTYNSLVTVPTITDESGYAEYSFTWSIGNGICDPETDNVTITFYAEPSIADAGEDVDACGTLSGTFAGETPSVGEGAWTLVSGAGNPSIDDASSATSTFQVPAYGSYTFRWTISNGSCTDKTDDVVYNFYETPVATTGNDFAVCGNQATLTGNNPSAGTGTWTVPSGITLSNPNDYNATATADPLGNYTMTWSVSNGTCDVVYSELTVSYKESPVADAGTDGISCTGVDGYNMTGTLASSETGTWTASPNNPGTATFIDANLPSSNVWFPVAGTYNFTWTVSNGTCTDADDVILTVYDPVNVPANATISGDDKPSAGTNNIQYSIPNYSEDLVYSWYYTPASTCEGSIPTINNDTENVVYLDYALNDCDGTLSVSLTDKCGNVSTFTLDIDVQNIPVITGATLNSNTELVVNTNEPIFTDCSSNPITPADFQLFFNKNAGTATGATITNISGTNPYTFTISVTGTPNGCETIEVKPIVDGVYNSSCDVMSNVQTTGQINLKNMTSPSAASVIGIDAYAKQATIAWTIPTGAKSLVVVNEDGVFNDPSNYTIYPANSSYGTETYNPGNGYTVYNGSGNTVTVVGLDDETNYNVAIWTYTEECGDNNEFFNMTETTAIFGTKKLATKLVAVNPPTKITSGSPFNLAVQAVDDNDEPAYPGCDETLYLSGSAALSTTTLELTGTTATFTNVVYTDADGDCDHVFTFDDNSTCSYTLTAGTFTADVAPTEPTTHAKTLLFSKVQKNQITVKWTNGSGTGRLLAVKKDGLVPLNAFVDGTDYSTVSTTSSTSFTSGYDMGNDVKGVFLSTDTNQATVYNLTNGALYNFRVVEYNKPVCDTDWSLANFKNSGTAILNPRSINTLAKLGSFNGVEIAYFDGKSYQLQVDLNWEAITEDGIAYYEIYRQDMYSEDMIKVGSANVNVSAGAGSKYTVADNKGLALGETYVYRLVGVDFNGQTSDLAETIVTVNDDVNINANLTIGSVNPNPVKDVVRFDVSTTQLSPVYIEIRDVEGKVIYTEERMINGTSTVEYRMNVKAAGSYFITVTSGLEGAVTSFIYQP